MAREAPSFLGFDRLIDTSVRGDFIRHRTSGFAVSLDLDLNPQKARVLTQLLIANGITSPAQVQKAFEATQ